MRRQSGIIAINAAALIFGSAALYGRLPLSATWIVAGRSGLAAATLWAIFSWQGDTAGRLKGQGWRITGAGLLLAGHWLAFYLAVQRAGVAVGTLTFATFPLFTVLMKAITARRWPALRSVVAALMILTAVALLGGLSQLGNSQLGTLCGLGSALLYAMYWQLSRPLATVLPATLNAALQSTVVFISCLPIALLDGPGPTSLAQWAGLLALGIFNTAAGLALYEHALNFLDATTCSAFIALEPIYAIALARLIFGESPPSETYPAAALIIGASLLMLYQESRDHRPTAGD
jgi:drug/metabolite transporter (DMT)-like permease